MYHLGLLIPDSKASDFEHVPCKAQSLTVAPFLDLRNHVTPSFTEFSFEIPEFVHKR